MLRKALATLPKTLDDTYSRILDSIDDEHQANALKLLQWLSYSARPLRIQELAEIFTVDKTDIEDEPKFDSDRRLPEPRDVLVICSSLVSTVLTTRLKRVGQGPVTVELVRLAHFSIKEYLASERIQAGSTRRWYIREVDAHVSIAETCLAYLLQFDRADSLTWEILNESPLAKYAAEHWPEHARLAGKEHKEVHQLIMKLFMSKKEAYDNTIKIFNPESQWNQPDLTMRVTDILPPLYYAVGFCLAESTRLLVEAGVDVNARGGKFCTALKLAARRGYVNIVEQLIEANADVNTEGSDDSALQLAACQDNENVVQRLLDAGADVNVEGNGGTALFAATKSGYENIVQRLLDAGADVNFEGRHGPALQKAAEKGYENIVQKLLDAGANINAGGYLDTALQRAVRKSHENIIQILLHRGADVNARGGVYGTALELAIGSGSKNIAQSLLDAGADPNARGGAGGTALQQAAKKGYCYIAQKLLDAGADVNAEGTHGTALQRAKRGGHDIIVQLLLKAGAKEEAP